MLAVLLRKLALIVAVGMALATTPAAAQFSDGYNFLKAVKDRDGTKATEFLSEPGSTLIGTRDQTTGETALHITVQRRDETWTQFLLERGANPNIGDKRGVTPLALASSLGFVDGVELLIKRGARVDVPNSAGETPLISAVHRRDMPMIRLLLKNGANADRADNSGRSARDYAQLMGSASGVLDEIARAEAERKTAPVQDSYGPGL
jgi:ankyrin repeat protein